MSERPAQLTPPPSSQPALHARATGWLLFATVLWGASFPLSKALYLAQGRLLPGADTWFLAALTLVLRFALAAAVLILVTWRSLRGLTRLEIAQGIGLGIFAAGGMLLQMDGINYTAASTSAFLTACYCVVIPIIVACRQHRWPPGRVAAGCILAVLGMAILAGVTPHSVRLARGETETALASLFFAGQILWLERPVYARNRTSHATLIMFATLAVVALPVTLARCHGAGEIFVAAAGSASIISLLLILTLGCTLVTFTLMNHWQRHVEATEAGLIYCAEPVWASLAALFLPAWLAMLTGAVYPNETLSVRLLLGGVCITAANIVVQLKPR